MLVCRAGDGEAPARIIHVGAVGKPLQYGAAEKLILRVLGGQGDSQAHSIWR